MQEKYPAIKKFNYLMNLLNVQEINHNLLKSTHLPNIFVCLNISMEPLFIEEFIEGFLAQEYPANLLDILVISNNNLAFDGLNNSKKFRYFAHKHHLVLFFLAFLQFQVYKVGH